MSLPPRPRRSPFAWLTGALVGGLVLVFAGSRIAPSGGAARLVLSGAGTLLVLLAVAWAALVWARSREDARAVARTFLLGYAGTLLALILFFLAGGGAERLGIDFADTDAASRFATAATVLAAVVLSASLLPTLAAQWAAGSAGAEGAPGAVDRLRVTQVALAGLTVGLAAPFLLLAGWVASERDRTLDLSYFRTSSPGSASQQIVENLGSPLRVVLFFPPASPVRDQVRGYFRALGAGGNVRVEEHDRLAAPLLAEQFGVVSDGTVILSVADRVERIAVPVQLRAARPRLRILDGDVQQALMRLAREARTVYLTVGHGELNDRATATVTDTTGFGSVLALQSLLDLLNYRVRELGLQSGLGTEVPPDAAMVLSLGPRRPFHEAEMGALDRYLARGGSLLLALEPDTPFEPGLLGERLRFRYHRTPLADDASYIAVNYNLSDRRMIVTDRIFTHAATPTASTAGVGAAVAFMGAAHIEPAEESARVSVLVRSMPTTFPDEARDFTFRESRVERLQYPLVLAVSAPAEAAPEQTMRGLVFADSEMFGDRVLHSLGLNLALVADAIRWLGHEEALSGETVSEADVPIVHTRTEDVAWFYSTILGAPALVLALGLLAIRRRRRGRETPGEP